MSGITDQIYPELKQIQEIFPSDHPTYQVANQASEEILFIFVTSEEKHKLRCSIAVWLYYVNIFNCPLLIKTFSLEKF